MSAKTIDQTRAAIDALLARLNIKYSATFVPQSVSRNAAEPRPCLNWVITLQGPKGPPMLVQYMQGIGHVPDYPSTFGRETYEQREKRLAYERAAETGRSPKYWRNFGIVLTAPLPVPHASEIIYSLLMDDPRNQTFDEWCQEYGMDTDSRKAEESYRQCCRQTQDAQRIFGNEVLNEARLILEDYCT
jgi:hypothetical protein